MLNAPLLSDLLAAVGLDLTPDQVSAFEGFAQTLYKANEVMNLTRGPRKDCAVRHFFDRLMFQDLIPFHAGVLDIGTGPGFPAWPLACARPDLSVTALDSSGKMIGFLRTQPLPNLEPVLGRAEEFGRRETFEVVTGRALAPLPTQLEVSAAPCAVGGLVIPMRTPGDDFSGVSLAPLGLELVEVVDRPLADTGVVRSFPVYLKVRPTDARYPRRWPEIRSHPL
jgi:16S rRNA (guanine527-N7)-methyltransferase